MEKQQQKKKQKERGTRKIKKKESLNIKLERNVDILKLKEIFSPKQRIDLR